MEQIYLHPLDDLHHYHACPVALLLIHALQNSLVRGESIEQILQFTVCFCFNHELPHFFNRFLPRSIVLALSPSSPSLSK